MIETFLAEFHSVSPYSKSFDCNLSSHVANRFDKEIEKTLKDIHNPKRSKSDLVFLLKIRESTRYAKSFDYFLSSGQAEKICCFKEIE